jgi:hypothetical protein
MTDDLAAPPLVADRPRLDDVTVRALDLVVDANGDLDLWFSIGAGALEGRSRSVERFARRAGVDPGPLAAVAVGLVAVPAVRSVELCRAFCRRQPRTILNHLSAVEVRLDHGATPPGGAHVARDARALVRSWARGDA